MTEDHNYTTGPLAETTLHEPTSPMPKRIRMIPSSHTEVNWPESRFLDLLDRPLYQIVASELPFVVKYKPETMLINDATEDSPNYYFQVIGYDLNVTIRYGVPVNEPTQPQVTDAITHPGHTPLIWYHLATYERATRQQTDFYYTIPVMDLDTSTNWKIYENENEDKG